MIKALPSYVLKKHRRLSLMELRFNIYIGIRANKWRQNYVNVKLAIVWSVNVEIEPCDKRDKVLK